MLTLTYRLILGQLDHYENIVKVLVGLGMNIGSRIDFCKFFRTVMLAKQAKLAERATQYHK